MKSVDVIARIGLGEDSRTRFLPNVTDEDTLAQELVSLANGRGGCVYLGVDDRGRVLALSTMNRAQARRAIHANKYIDTEDFSNPMPKLFDDWKVGRTSTSPTTATAPVVRRRFTEEP